eukprot:2814522-Pyramimonas_sp.AAC.1
MRQRRRARCEEKLWRIRGTLQILPSTDTAISTATRTTTATSSTRAQDEVPRRTTPTTSHHGGGKCATRLPTPVTRTGAEEGAEQERGDGSGDHRRNGARDWQGHRRRNARAMLGTHRSAENRGGGGERAAFHHARRVYPAPLRHQPAQRGMEKQRRQREHERRGNEQCARQ